MLEIIIELDLVGVWRDHNPKLRKYTRRRHERGTFTFFLNIKEERKKYLFNDELNKFYLRLYCVGHMVKVYSDRERGNPLPAHRILFLISSKVLGVGCF